jgi:hypothetical protein
MIFLQLRSGNSGPAFQGENQNDTLLWDTTERKFFVGPGGGVGGVTSWNGRTGVVVPQSGDYDSDEVDNASTVAGASVSDALEHLQSEIDALELVPLSNALYVDKDSVATGSPNGSIGNPFTTITAAMAAAQPIVSAGKRVVILLTPSDYSAEAPADFDNTPGNLAFVGLNVYDALDPDQGRSSTVVRPILPEFSFTNRDGALAMVGCEEPHNVQYGVAVPFGGPLLIKDTLITGSGLVCTGCRVEHSVIGTLIAYEGGGQECTLINVDFVRGGGQIITSTSENCPLYLEDCTFRAGGPVIEFTSGSPGEVSMDQATRFNFDEAGGVLTNCTIVMRGGITTGHKRATYFGQINSAAGTGGPVAPGANVRFALNTGEGPTPFVDLGSNAVISVAIAGNPGAHTMVVQGADVDDGGTINVTMINAGTAPDDWNNIPFYCFYET